MIPEHVSYQTDEIEANKEWKYRVDFVSRLEAQREENQLQGDCYSGYYPVFNTHYHAYIETG